ncbi:MAG: peptidylprolyl isomerase [Undibacterium sp.]|nr:peptidylprolyl isomerase [Opitutaceae bacterium]
MLSRRTFVRILLNVLVFTAALSPLHAAHAATPTPASAQPPASIFEAQRSTLEVRPLPAAAPSSAHAADSSSPTPPVSRLPEGLYAEFTTPDGAFTVELLYQRAPLTCASFVGRAEGTLAPRPDGKPFFTGLKWYRVVPGFVIQSGDPTKNTGAEDDTDPGHPLPFPDEFVPGLRHDAAGILSMANGGPDDNSSEFFLTLAPVNRLNYLHAVFGRTVRGLEILPHIRQGDALTITIVRIGDAAKAFKADLATFNALAAGKKKYGAAKEPGPDSAFDDPQILLPAEPPRAKAFNFKLANFERATGVKIRARLFAKSPTAADDAAPGQFMRALAKKLGTEKSGAVVAYFADEKDWRIWIGDDLTSTFLGRPAIPTDLGDDGAFHKVKDAFLTAVQTSGDAAFAAQKAAAPADKSPPPAQHLKLETDALLDALIFKLEPK